MDDLIAEAMRLVMVAGWALLIYVVVEDTVAAVCRWYTRRRFGDADAKEGI